MMKPTAPNRFFHPPINTRAPRVVSARGRRVPAAWLGALRSPTRRSACGPGGPALLLAATLALLAGAPATQSAPPPKRWQVGVPIVTYWAGPAITDAAAGLMKAGGWNLIWCRESELAVAQSHGLRAMLVDDLLNPQSVDDPARRAKLEALIQRVKNHPALYNYFITDEPSAGAFPALGKLVALLRQLDPAHFSYINLFPTYANNQQLGTPGETVPAYKEHLRQYLEFVKPELISYDHYHFQAGGKDGPHYFLNLGLIRQTALDAGVPFLNIVQACSWHPSMRVPKGDELRWLAYTSLAYGAQGLSYYVYFYPHDHRGMMLTTNGEPTELYFAAKEVNPEFEAIAQVLQPLRSLGAYHLGMVPPGTQPLPDDSPFTLKPVPETRPLEAGKPVEGWLLGFFGAKAKATCAVVVNLDYKQARNATVVGTKRLDLFDARTRTWSKAGGRQATLELPPGGGKLLRLR